MDFNQLINTINPEIYESLKLAVEIGKWPNGEKLSREQVGLCMQAIITYETKNLPEEQRTGYVPSKKPTACADDHVHADPKEEAIVKWKI